VPRGLSQFHAEKKPWAYRPSSFRFSEVRKSEPVRDQGQAYVPWGERGVPGNPARARLKAGRGIRIGYDQRQRGIFSARPSSVRRDCKRTMHLPTIGGHARKQGIACRLRVSGREHKNAPQRFFLRAGVTYAVSGSGSTEWPSCINGLEFESIGDNYPARIAC
jgi:hypothetical protein